MTPSISPLIRRACALALMAVLAAVLVACGGGGNSDPASDNSPPVVAPPTAERAGRLESSAALGTIAASDIAAALSSKESLAQDVVPRFGVTSYRLE